MGHEGDERRRIIAAAADELIAAGPGGFSTAGLARRLRCSKRTIYRCFDSKDDLLAAVVDDFFDRLARDVEELLRDASGDPFDRLRHVATMTAGHLRALDDGFLVQLERHQPRAAEHARRRRALHVHGYLGATLAEAQTAGLARDDLPADLVVEMVVACIDRLTAPDVLQRLDAPVKDLPSLVISTFVDGLRPPDPSGRAPAPAPPEPAER